MNPNALLLLICIIIPIFIAIGAYNMAKKKHRTPWLWFVICLLTGLLGLFVLWCSKYLDYNEELEYNEDWDCLGWIMLPISLIWLVVTFYYGYYSAKSYHDAMMFDAMMQLMR